MAADVFELGLLGAGIFHRVVDRLDFFLRLLQLQAFRQNGLDFVKRWLMCRRNFCCLEQDRVEAACNRCADFTFFQR